MFDSQYQDSVEIVSSTCSLLAALVTPLGGQHADISQVSSISGTLCDVSEYYTDLYALSDDPSELRPILCNLLLVLFAISEEDPSVPDYFSTFLTVSPFWVRLPFSPCSTLSAPFWSLLSRCCIRSPL